MSERFSEKRSAWLQCLMIAEGLSAGAMRLGAWLALKYASRETGIAWPSFERLATDLKINVKTVSRHIKELEEAKWLKVQRARNRGEHSTFYLAIEKVHCVRNTTDEKADNAVPHSGQETRQNCLKKATNLSDKGRQECPANLNREPKKEPSGARDANADKPWTRYTVGGTTAVLRDSDAGKAWSRFLQTLGYPYVWPGNGMVKWWFPSEWPPKPDAKAA